MSQSSSHRPFFVLQPRSRINYGHTKAVCLRISDVRTINKLKKKITDLDPFPTQVFFNSSSKCSIAVEGGSEGVLGKANVKISVVFDPLFHVSC